ncbi:hypothetical protein GUITHDRAFT_139308 [Guillardia theta CCMP2712]|uniref:Protein zer-1 homolog-like C-terminal domain-containing protein n=1 Tax=Guillardia theta (strain CCMP2712) TaxID=905079 RepID=L1J925_GUITC|nr:hypothetical protein GUITHDRAFT_139308 [Guillardia theta CCMP2712]EKX45031.1 hypothetical protein GUITHDRAFT_139308 [Guillardia theta CCMP2712]|eukprot:XP_005832011.1 hypothetical protein GUITHDRAFT_139308 [Guillardia theta CCMP2712]
MVERGGGRVEKQQEEREERRWDGMREEERRIEEEEEEEEDREKRSRTKIFGRLLERIPGRGSTEDASSRKAEKISDEEMTEFLNFLLDQLDDEDIQRSACEVIYRLSACHLYQKAMFSLDIKEVLIAIMARHKGVAEIQTLGCRTFLYLSGLFRFNSSDLVQRDIIACLIAAMVEHATVIELQISACRALRFMAANHPANKERIRSKSGVELVEHVRKLHGNDLELVEAADKFLSVLQNDFFSSDSEKMLRYIVSDLEQHSRVLQVTSQNLHLLLYFLTKSEQDLCMMLHETMSVIRFCMKTYKSNTGVQEVICNILIAMIKVYGCYTLLEFFPDMVAMVSANKKEYVRDARLCLLLDMLAEMLTPNRPPVLEERGAREPREQAEGYFSFNEEDDDAVAAAIQDSISKMQQYKFSPVVQEVECSKLKELSLSTKWLHTISTAGGVEATMEAMNVHKEERSVALQACWTLKHLTYHVRNQGMVVELHGVQLLLDVMRRHVEDANVMEQACGAMTNLVYKSAGSRREFMEEKDGIAVLLRVVEVHAENSAVVLNSIWAMSNVMERNETYQVVFVTMDGVHLTCMAMKLHMPNLSVQYQCLKLLRNLAESEQVRRYAGLKGYRDVIKMSMQRHQENSMMVEMGSFILEASQQEV